MKTLKSIILSAILVTASLPPPPALAHHEASWNRDSDGVIRCRENYTKRFAKEEKCGKHDEVKKTLISIAGILLLAALVRAANNNSRFNMTDENRQFKLHDPKHGLGVFYEIKLD